LLDGQPGVARDAAHRECIDRIVAGDDHDALTIAHDNVFALAHNPESGFFESADGVNVIDARDLGQASDHHFDFANFLAAELFVDNRQILANRVLYVFQGLVFRGTL
jgi:hypothetical protein